MNNNTISVPKIEQHTFHAKQHAYMLIIGVLNEGEKFTRQLEALQPYRSKIDILIADGNSTDGATSIEHLKDKVRLLCVNKDSQKGLSVQYRAAIHYALQEGYSGIIMMDGNGKDGPEAIDGFIAALNKGYDFIQGSRFMPGGYHENTPLDRIIGIRFLFNPLMNIASGFSYTDGMNGFKACSKRFLEDIRIQPFRAIFTRYGLQYYFNYSAAKHRFRVTEIPVSRCYQKGSLPQSKIVGLRPHLNILLELWNTISGKYNP